MKRRLYAGRFLKALREDHGLKQGALAQRLGISTPYLSQLENDTRPMTLALAERVRELFPVDWADMAETPVEPVVTELLEASADPLLRDLPADQIERVADQFPQFAEQFAHLYRLHKRDSARLAAMDEALGADSVSGGRLPWEEVRDWFHLADNYVHLIDSSAEAMAGALSRHLPTPDTAQLTAWFDRQGITLRHLPGAPIRHYDEARRELTLDVGQPHESLRFQLAYQLCAGSEITKELSARGHQVVAVARKPEAIPAADGVTAVAGDASNPAALADVIKGVDAVISALHFDVSADTLLSALRQAGVGRLLVTGGAASLKLPTGERLIDGPDFPEAWKGAAMGGITFLEDLRAVTDIDWTFFSPAAFIFEGPRLGTYRGGKDDLVVDAAGESKISFADYAIAMVDELEAHKYPRARFTAAY